MSFNNWKKYKIGEIVDFHNTKRVALNSREREIRKGYYPYYGASGIVDYLSDYTFDGEYVLISEDGENLRTRKTPIVFIGNGKFRVNNHAHIVQGKQDFINKWLVYFFQNFDINPFITGAVQPKLNKENLQLIEIPIPEINIAKKIISILSSLDDKIELNRQTNQTLETIAQTLFKEMCVPKSEVLPDGWCCGKLGDFYKTTSGGTPSRTIMQFYEDGSINWVKSKELGDFFVLDTEEKITEEALKKSSAKLLPINSILLAMYGATVGEISILGKEASCNQAICAILPNNDFPYSFIYEFLKNQKENLKSMAVGGAQQNISQLVILGIDLIMPSENILTEFHQKADAIYNLVRKNIEETQTLLSLRDSLLPKLMKGEINVNISKV